jgi:uncharacterized protein (TIGR02145 family)
MKKQFNIFIIILTSLIFSSCKEKPVPPVLSTTPVSLITAISASSGGSVTDDGGAPIITRGVCWNTSDNPVITNNKTSDGEGSGTYTSNLTQLIPNTTYFIRAYATNSIGISYGSSVSFVTLGDKPVSTAANATEILTTSAKLNGTVNLNSLSTTVTFEWGTTTNYGNIVTPSGSPATGSTSINFSTNLSGLTPGTTYHYRIKAINEYGTSAGNDVTFTTLGSNPSLSGQSAKEVKVNTAKLTSSVNPNYLNTSVVFEWGTTSGYGNTAVFDQNPLTGWTYLNVSVDLTGLNPETTYYCRVKATNELGTTYSENFLFKTYVAIDGEGNGYNSVVIGTQTWLTENLKTTKYLNGDLIGTTNPSTLNISDETEPRYQWAYGGNESNVATYGRLYTWFAATDNRKVCPTGWHVASDPDWTIMENYLNNNGYNFDGSTSYTEYNKIAKSLASKSYWKQSDKVGSVGNTDYPEFQNKTGFSALPGGTRSNLGSFTALGEVGYWWLSTESDALFAYVRNIYYANYNVNRIGNHKRELGLSLRCVKN